MPWGVQYTSAYPCCIVLDSTATAVVMHKRATVTGTAGELSTLISGGIPSWTGISDLVARKPSAVMLQAEAGSSSTIYLTLDSTSTPATTLGLPVPTAPGSIVVTGSDIANGLVKAATNTGTAYMQCFFMP